MGKTYQMDKTGYVWIDGSSISVFGIDSGSVRPAITKKLIGDQHSKNFIDLVKDRDDIDLFTNEDTTKLANAFEPRDGEARHGIKIGIDEDIDSSLTNADSKCEEDSHGLLRKNNI
ncbi:unnamed protein product [Phytophthora lilii]|uniref:Unnamed protein product n=1 Tax=Phytophthora lilii TaxID=2077276 RepID=A0A9W6U4V5_9STRA|nr:unnamed protein product [Phytophthora lilii]